jgi:pyruvate formate lyase activating enzyme
VSNGNATPQVLDYLTPWVDVYKVDLKSFNDRQYRKLGGRLQPILDTIQSLHARGVWLEIVTLLVPGFNDSEEELTALTEFLASVSFDIPWHVTAFHQDYRMRDTAATTASQLQRAAALGRRAGLRHVYAGNLPGAVGDLEDTRCASCSQLLVARFGYHIHGYHVTADGTCPACKRPVPGRWDAQFGGQAADRPFLPHDRTRRLS